MIAIRDTTGGATTPSCPVGKRQMILAVALAPLVEFLLHYTGTFFPLILCGFIGFGVTAFAIEAFLYLVGEDRD